MGKFQVELYKGNDELPIDSELASEGDLDINQAVYGVKLAFDKGEADKAAIFVESDDDELLGIVTKSKGEFDVKEVAVEINQILQGE